MSILILGGAGFVGRHYAEYFLKKKEFVEVVDNIAPLSGGIHPKKWKLFIGNIIVDSKYRHYALDSVLSIQATVRSTWTPQFLLSIARRIYPDI